MSDESVRKITAEGDAPMQIIVESGVDYNNWRTVAEFFPEPIHYPLTALQRPSVVVRQHRDTRELRIDVYGCDDGLDLTFTNGGSNDDRAKWYRDLHVNKSRHAPPLRVRLLGSNVDLKT